MPSIGRYQYRELILNGVIAEEQIRQGQGRPPKVSGYTNISIILLIPSK